MKRQKRQHLNRSVHHGMAFELAMRSFFGEKAFHTASYAEGDNAIMKKWLLKVVKK